MPKIGDIHDRLSATEHKELPDQFKGLYVEDGDGFVYADPSKLKASMVNAKAEKTAAVLERDELKTKFKDVDPAKYVELLAKSKDFENIDKAKQDGIDAVKRDLESKFTGQLTAAQQKLVKAQSQHASYILNDQIARALAKAGVTDAGAKLLTGNLLNAVTTKVDDEGEPEFRILDAKKNQRLTDNADPYTINDLVADARKEFPQLFGSGSGSGSGSGNQDKNVSAPTDENVNDWSPAQKKAYIAANGHEKYRVLLQRAQKRVDDARVADRTKKRA